MSRRPIHSDSSNTAGSIFSTLTNFQHSTPNITRVMSCSQQSRNSPNMNLSSAENSHNLTSRSHQNDPVPRSVIYKTTHTEHYKYRREIMYGDSGKELSDVEIHGRHDYVEHTKPKLDISFAMGIADSRKRLSTEDQQRGVNAVDSKWSKALRLVQHGQQYLCLFFAYILLLDLWFLSQFSNMRKWVHSRGRKILWIALLVLVCMLLGWWTVLYVLSIMESIVVSLLYPFTVLTSVFDSIMSMSLNVKHDTMENSGSQNTGPIVNQVMIEKMEELQRNYNTSFGNQNIMQTMERMEKLQLNYENHLSNISQVIATIIKNAEDLRRDYDKKLMNVENELKQMKALLLSSNNERIKVENTLNKAVSMIENHIAVVGINKDDKYPSVGKGMTRGEVREIVNEALKVYDADKTGRVDYALESAGAQIVSTGSTQQYRKHSKAYSIFGYMLFFEDNSPRIVIEGKPVQPGACWAFQNFPGLLLIKLRSLVVVTGFTLEHVPKSLQPYGQTKSTVRKFEVWIRRGEYINHSSPFHNNASHWCILRSSYESGSTGPKRDNNPEFSIQLNKLAGFGKIFNHLREYVGLQGLENENDAEPVQFGDYEFMDSDESLQYFPVQNSTITTPYQYVELRIHSNHGHLEYTCVYRFRVHGTPA